MLHNSNPNQINYFSQSQVINPINESIYSSEVPKYQNPNDINLFQTANTDRDNSKWLLKTIKSLCKECNKLKKYKEIKSELKLRGMIHFPDKKEKEIDKQNVQLDNEGDINKVKSLTFSEIENEKKIIKDVSVFPQIYSTIDVIKENNGCKILKVQNLIDRQIYALRILTLTSNDILYAMHEIQCLARLKSPRIIRYFTSWIEEIPNSQLLSFFIQTEYFENRNLQYFLQLCKENQITKINIFHKIFYELCEALIEIHQAGIVHRDLQPSNIMLRSNFSPAISGFKISSSNNRKKLNLQKNSINNSINCDQLNVFSIDAAENAINFSIRNLGSPLYASPQQLNGRKSNPSDDIYSFGIIMFESLANFENDAKRKNAIRQLRNNGTFPEKFEENFKDESKLILKMTRHDPLKRPSSSQIIQTELFQKWKKDLSVKI